MRSEMPKKIQYLIGRCELGEDTFDNDDMSLALKFGELLWNRLTRVAEHYELLFHNLTENRINRPYLREAAESMRHILNDTKKDIDQ